MSKRKPYWKGTSQQKRWSGTVAESRSKTEAAPPDTRPIFDRAKEGVFQATPTGELLYANPAVASMYGYSSAEAMMAEVSDVNALYLENGRREEFNRRLLDSGAVSGFRLRVQRRDGEVIWVSEHATLLRAADGDVLGFLSTVRDVTRSVTAERAVSEAESTWPSLVEHTSDCLLVADREGSISFVSPRAKESLGVKVGERLSELVAKRERAVLDEAIAQVANRGDAEVLELNAAEGGLPRWLEFRLVPIRRSRQSRETAVIVGDISDRKLAEEELRTSRRFSESLADTLPAVLYIFDLAHRRFTYVNDHATKILGYTPERWLAMDWPTFSDIVHPADLPLMEERLRHLAAAVEGDVFECDYRLRHLRGDWRSVRVRETVFRVGENGSPGEILGMVYDISDQVGMRGAIRKSEIQLRALVERTQAVPWEYDLEAGAFAYVGPQAERLLGFPIEDWYRPGFWIDRVHPEDREMAIAARKFLGVSTQAAQCEYRLVAADDRVVWVHDTVHSDIDEGDRELLRGFSLDTTEPRRIQQEREEANQQLRALSERLVTTREEERAHLAREFHDQLGQELTGLKMDLRWIMQRTAKAENAPDEDLNRRTDDMMKAIDGMIHTVRSIATSLRPAVLDECGLGMAIEWQAIEFERRSGIRCAVENRWTREFENTGAATALFRIFQEILTNVSRHAEARNVKVRLMSNRREDMMEVSDDGCGITDSQISKSLGILGMRERAAAIGGQLEIEGRPGKGTTVRVRLPLESAMKSQQETDSASSRIAWLFPWKFEH